MCSHHWYSSTQVSPGRVLPEATALLQGELAGTFRNQQTCAIYSASKLFEQCHPTEPGVGVSLAAGSLRCLPCHQEAAHWQGPQGRCTSAAPNKTCHRASCHSVNVWPHRPARITSPQRVEPFNPGFSVISLHEHCGGRPAPCSHNRMRPILLLHHSRRLTHCLVWASSATMSQHSLLVCCCVQVGLVHHHITFLATGPRFLRALAE